MKKGEAQMNKQEFLGQVIVHDGAFWKVVGVGAERDGATFCHLLNLHRGRQQRNGWNPVQINDWVETSVLNASK
jgi:hypothetical protein